MPESRDPAAPHSASSPEPPHREPPPSPFGPDPGTGSGPVEPGRGGRSGAPPTDAWGRPLTTGGGGPGGSGATGGDPGSGRGCSKGLLVGCGVVLVVLGIGAILVLVNIVSLADWMLVQTQRQLEASLPEDLPEEDRRRLDRAFEEFRAALADGRLAQSDLRAVQSRMLELAGKDPDDITREDVLALAEALEEAAGVAPNDEVRAPARGIEGDDVLRRGPPAGIRGRLLLLEARLRDAGAVRHSLHFGTCYAA